VQVIIKLNMFQPVRVSTKSWVLNTLKVNLIICLIVVAFIVPSSYATSSCSGASAYPVICKCDNGRTERIVNADQFKKARADPDSCCYYEPKPSVNTFNQQLPFMVEIGAERVNVPTIEVQKPIKPIVEEVNEVQEQVRVEVPIETMVQVETKEVNTSKGVALRVVLRSVFQLLLPKNSHISNLLFS